MMMMMGLNAENRDLVSLPQGGCIVSSSTGFSCFYDFHVGGYSYSTNLQEASPVDFGVLNIYGALKGYRSIRKIKQQRWMEK